MKYWAYLNDDVSQKPYSEDELRQLPGFGPDLLVCSETSAVSAEPDWRPVKDLLPHLIRPKAPNFAKFRPKPPVPMANTSTPEQSFQQPQQQMPQSMPMTQDTLPIPNVLPAGISAMPMPQYGQVNMQMPVQNQPQQTFAQNDLSMALLAQLESLNSKINSLENKIVEQEKELAEAYNKPEDDYNPPTLISEPQNEQEDDVLEVPFEDDFVSSVGKSSEEIAKEAEDILSNPTSAEIEEYNTDDQKTELMTFGSDIQNILENTIRQDLKEAELKKMKQLEENQEKPIIAEDLISRTMLSFPANGSKPQVTQQEEDIQETTSSDELNIDDLDALLEQQNQSSEDEKEEILEEQPAQEEVAEEKAAEETPVEETPAEDVTEQKEEVVEEQPVQEEVAEEKVAEETPVEETPAEDVTEQKEEVVEEQPAQEEVAEEKVAEETPVEETPAEDITEQKEEVVEEQPAQEEVAEEKVAEETPVEETPAEDVTEQKEEVVEEQPAQEEVAEEKVAEETPVEETPAEDVTEQKEEVVEEQPAQEEVAEEKAAEETPVEETPVVEQPLEDVVEEQSTEETPTVEQPLEDPYQINEDLIDQQEVKEEITEEDQHVVSLSDADDLKIKDPTENYSEQIEPQDVFSDLQQNVTEDIIEETPAEEQPAKDIIEQKEEVVAETPVEGEQPKEEGINDEDPLTSGVSISKDDTTAAVLDEIAHEKSNDIVPETTPDQLFEEFENTVQENEAEKENLNVDAIIEETKNQPMPQVNENAPVNEDNEKLEEMPKDLPKEDEFLKTFTMSVEEVFLDQPTAIISDYVPPSDNTQRNIQNLADTSTGLTMATIRREKPSDIKTVPLVSGAMGQEIWSSPYVESATAQLRKKTKFHDTLKFGIIVGAAILIIVIVYTFFAVMGIVPEKLSPLHRIVYSLQKSPEEKVSKGEEMAPEVIEDTNIAAVPNEPEVPPQVEHQAPVQAPASKPAEPEMTGEELVIQSVKSYAFKDGTTLEQRILAAHPNLGGNMDWSLYPTEEEDVFSIAIKLPPNNAGQSFSYRFNYNIISEQLTPTTSEAKNIMKK